MTGDMVRVGGKVRFPEMWELMDSTVRVYDEGSDYVWLRYDTSRECFEITSYAFRGYINKEWDEEDLRKKVERAYCTDKTDTVKAVLVAIINYAYWLAKAL